MELRYRVEDESCPEHGAILGRFGTIRFLQGINVLPGSFMTGQIRWAVYGGVAMVVGIMLLLAANRKPADGGNARLQSHTGKHSAREIREYFIPDFSNWKNHDEYRRDSTGCCVI